jgi:hypothetical protein
MSDQEADAIMRSEERMLGELEKHGLVIKASELKKTSQPQ